MVLVSIGAKDVEVAGKNVSDSAPFGQTIFYFPSRVVVSKENYFYTVLSLLAEIGGYVGLLLGVSLFHLAAGLSQIIERQIRKFEGRQDDT